MPDKYFLELIRAIQDGKLKRLTKQQRNILSVTDDRPTNTESLIFHGFCPIHYAVYSKNMLALKLIYENSDMPAITGSEIFIPFSRYPASTKYLLPDGTDVLSLSILVDNDDATALFLRDKRLQHCQSNDKSQCAFYVALMCQNDCSLLCLQDESFVQEQMCLVSDQGENIFHSIFLLKRSEFLNSFMQKYLYTSKVDPAFKLLFYSLFFSQNNYNQTVLQCVDEVIDFTKVGGSEKDFKVLRKQAFDIEMECRAFLVQHYNEQL